MPDTQRSTAALIALYADNTARAISEQDLRDGIVSAFGGYGAIYVNDGATAQNFTAATPAKLTGFAANGISSGMTPDEADDELVIGVDGDHMFACSLAMTAQASAIVKAQFRKNGTAVTGARTQGKADATGKLTLSWSFPFAAVATDSITVWLESDTTGNITLIDGILHAKRIG